MKIKIKRKCKCGCGNITNPGRKYINGHSMINRKHSVEANRKLSVSMMGNTNAKRREGNWHIKIRRRCKCGCGEIVNPGRIWINGHYLKGKNRSKEIIDKISLGLIGNTNSLGHKHSKGSKKERSNTVKKLWQDPGFQRKQKEARKLKPNKPEQFLIKLLNKLFPNEYKYIGNYQFFLGGKNPDFMNMNGQKKLIELYGDYWHKKESEQIRIDHFKKYGFDTLVIWENELKKGRLKLRRKLIDFHRS